MRKPSPRPRRKKPGLGSFLLWALTSWFLQRTNYRKTHNPFAAPASRRPAKRKRPAGRGGGGGGFGPSIGHTRGASRARGSGGGGETSRDAFDWKKAAGPDNIYGRYDPDLIVDAEIVDDVADEDVSIDDDPEVSDEIEGEGEYANAEIEGGSGE